MFVSVLSRIALCAVLLLSLAGPSKAQSLSLIHI